MSYDRYAVKSMGVDPEKWNWFKRDYSQYAVPAPIPHAPSIEPVDDPVQKSGEARKFRPVLLFVGLGIAVLYIAMIAAVISSMGGSPGEVSLGVYFTAGAVLGAILCAVPHIAARIIGGLVISLYLLAGLLSIGTGSVIAAICLLSLTALSFIPSIFIGKSLPRRKRSVVPKRSKQTVQRSHPVSGTIFGRPGSVGNATDVFSKEALEAGVEGEKRTAILISLLLKIPGTSVFHGLYFPGSRVADVDHAVSHGNTVFLIDSKMYRGSHYEWNFDGENDFIAGPGVPSKKNSMAAAAKGYRSILGRGITVVPIVLIHGRNVTIGPRRWSKSGVGLFTPQEALDYIGNQMAGNMTTWKDRPEVRSTLVSNMKSF